MTEDVLVSVDRNVGRIRLNRPKAIHALTREMCDAMSETLLAWRDDPSVQVVVIDHAEGRGFCAGGDVVMLARSGASDAEDAKKFFFSEYRLNHLLFTYPKPTVAIMDGITMGGGVGISLPCEYRIATESDAPRHAGDGHRPVSRRRRRLVPLAPAGPGRPVHGADRRTA